MILKYLFLFIIYFMEVLVLQLLLYVPTYRKKNRFPNIFVHLPVKIIVIGRTAREGKIHFKSGKNSSFLTRKVDLRTRYYFFNRFTLGKNPRHYKSILQYRYLFEKGGIFRSSLLLTL